MAAPLLRKAIVLSVVLAAVAALVRTLRGGPVPAFAPSGTSDAPWPTLLPDPEPAAESSPQAAPDWAGPVAAPPDAGPLAEPPADEPSEPLAEAIVVPSAASYEPVDGPALDRPWIVAPEGPPPASHPVKAKLGSGIYHLPGMTNYVRTKADRCYRSAEDAQADGLREAKR